MPYLNDQIYHHLITMEIFNHMCRLSREHSFNFVTFWKDI